MKILTRYGLGAMVTILSLAHSGIASAEMTEKDKEEIVEMVIDRIKRDPSIALELLSTLKQSVEGDKAQARDTLKSAPRMIELVEGNAQGDVVIMDFSDYGCEACNLQSKALLDAAAQNSRIKIILRDLPQSGEDATQASVDLIAAASAQKDWRVIRRTYLSGQIKPEMRIIALAEGHSYPSEADRDLAQIALEKNQSLAERSGIEKGPAAIMIVGTQVRLLPSPVTAAQAIEIMNELEQPVAD